MPNGIMTSFSPTHQTGTRADLNSELTAVGEGIVRRLSSVLEHKIAVTNLFGNIVADSDLANFDKYVPAATVAVQKGNNVPLPQNEIDANSGWVVPLRHQDRMYGTLIIRNSPSPSEDVIPLAKSLAELLLYQMLVMDKIAQESRILDKFFYDLFENEKPKEKLLRDSLFFNSQFFQIDLSQPQVAVVVVLKNFWNEVLKNQPVLPSDENKLSAIKDQIRDIFEKTLEIKPLIVAYLGIDEFALLVPHKIGIEKEVKKKLDKKTTDRYSFSPEQLQAISEQLEKKFGRQAYIGVGQYLPDISGLIQSYRGAKRAASLSMKLSPKHRVAYYSNLLLPIILEQADKSLQKQFVENELGLLIKHPDLVETLSTHFDSNLNLKKTAYELGIHKNTLYYRLAKIKKILDADPQEFGEAVRLKVALYLWQMLKENPDQPAV